MYDNNENHLTTFQTTKYSTQLAAELHCSSDNDNDTLTSCNQCELSCNCQELLKMLCHCTGVWHLPYLDIPHETNDVTITSTHGYTIAIYMYTESSR